MKSVTLTLPEPPSENVYYRRAGSRTYLSREGKAYKLAVLAAAGVNGSPLFPTGDVSVIVVWRRTLNSGDLDNRFKPLLDSLKSLSKRVPDPTAKGRVKSRRVVLKPGVYDDDGQVAMIWARRCDEHPELAPGTVRVEVSAL